MVTRGRRDSSPAWAASGLNACAALRGLPPHPHFESLVRGELRAEGEGEDVQVFRDRGRGGSAVSGF